MNERPVEGDIGPRLPRLAAVDVLISAPELAVRLLPEPEPALRLIDVRWRLGGPPGSADYRAGHLPGAVFADLDTQLAAPAGEGTGRHPLPDPADLESAARSWGLRDGDPVVVYDAVGGLSAARAWWLLRWAGVCDVRLLDGGLGAWVAAGLPLVEGEERAVPGDVRLSPGHMPVVEAAEIPAFVASSGVLLDARAAERFRGEPFPYDPQPGHVPGAVSAPTAENLGPDGRFRPAAELAARFAGLGVEPGRPAAAYCGSGITAAHEIAALAVAGIDGVALYPGSWSQWATLPGAPIER